MSARASEFYTNIPQSHLLIHKAKGLKVQVERLRAESKAINRAALQRGTPLNAAEQRHRASIKAHISLLLQEVASVEEEIAALPPPSPIKPERKWLDKQVRTAKYYLHACLESGLPEPLATEVALFLSTPNESFSEEDDAAPS